MTCRYRQVSQLLIAARENGFAPRKDVAEHLRGTLPTADRSIAETKRRRIVPRDWSTTNEETDPQPPFTPTTKETRR